MFVKLNQAKNQKFSKLVKKMTGIEANSDYLDFTQEL